MLYPTIQHLKVANTHTKKILECKSKMFSLRVCTRVASHFNCLIWSEIISLNPLFSLNPPDSNSFWSILLLFQFIPLLFQPFLLLFWPVSASLWVIPCHPASFHSVPAFSNTQQFPHILHVTN